ncbi:MAG: hypothetical protein HY692_03045 [Cyanobacteria bacterium NC_groundwater_1444_Ag_S-0.65um_54_12]|nr:hypothetical protein [Cyanobacteria bacterium NC_groundwater_1444_Ag_S-0.65um_54_12]
MTGTPQPSPQAAQRPRLLCPVMSYAQQQVPCVEQHCALWMKRQAQCGLVTHNERLEDGFEQLIRAVHDIKAKM